MNTYNTFKSGPRKGQPKTLTDRVIRFLIEGLKFTEVPSKSRYHKFIKNDLTYHVGNAGAVRAGKTSSDSFSITAPVHANMKLWERRNAQ